MNKWKYYIKAGLMAFVVSPMICNIGCFIWIVSWIFLQGYTSYIRLHAEWIACLPGVVSTIFILIISWRRFCKKTNMPESWEQRIAPVMAALIYYMVAWIVIFAVYQFFSRHRAWDFQFWLMLPYLLLHVTAKFSGNFIFFPVIQLASTVISLGTLVFTCRTKQPKAVIDKSVHWRGAAIIGAAVIIAIQAGCLYLYEDTLKTYDGINLTHYQPFGKKIPRLPVESSLKLTHDLPVLDGALALYPVYSAFATAVYPKAAYPLHTNSGKACYHGGAAQSGEKPHPVHFTNMMWNFQYLLNGRTDIYFMTEIPHDYRELAKKEKVDLIFTPIGRDAFVFFVNAKNPVNNLSVQDIRDIYSGRITQWEKLGLGDGKGWILAIQEKHSDVLDAFSMPLMVDLGGIVGRVADDKKLPGAIGFAPRFFVNEMAANSQIKVLKINGVEPTEENIRDGSYPLITHFYAITRADTTHPNVQLMLDWMVSDQGQYLVREIGYIPIRTVGLW